MNPGVRGIHTIGTIGVLILALVMMSGGCANRSSQMGVRNTWRSPGLADFKEGVSTQSDVMEALGPPSQVIGLHDQTVFYYLREESKAQALYLAVYNQSNEQITYDRAIFFFNRSGVLVDHSLSDEELPVD